MILLGQVPPIRGFDRYCEQKAIKLPFLDCKGRTSDVAQVDLPFNENLKQLANMLDQVSYFNVSGTICSNGRCSAYLQGKPIYYDQSHLSMKGSWKVGRRYIDRNGVPSSTFASATASPPARR